jgi:O-antigen biosynthesis protein
MNRWLRVAVQLPLLLASPFVLLIQLAGFLATDLLWKCFGKRRLQPDSMPDNTAASIVIPNWNGKDLLEKYLPSVVLASSCNPRNEVIVVDNGSSDGSADYLKQHFPEVTTIALKENLGFGGGSNTGFRAAKNDIVVLLNSDMRVAENFLAPLLDAFTAPDIFAVSCQIFLSNPKKVREETGLTQGSWSSGFLRVRHRIDEVIEKPYPCLYGGGGSCAFDRKKFLALGAFDELLRPFYYEDTDIGYLAWKRGWRILYQPASHVWHEHRGTIGKKFSPSFIRGVLHKNVLLMLWKNVHDWRRLLEHLGATYTSALVTMLLGPEGRITSFPGIYRAMLQFPEALIRRWHARDLAALSDEDALNGHLGSHYRDRYHSIGTEEKLRVLMVSPYGLAPASHGGAVFMQQCVRNLSAHANVHLIALLDEAWEKHAHEELSSHLRSMEFIVRMTGQPTPLLSLKPHSVNEFDNEDLRHLIERTMLTKNIDVLQLEYTNMGQYGARYQRLVSAIFEHDVYFQSIGRQLASNSSWLFRIPATLEYLKAIYWEMRMLRRFDNVQVCTAANRDYLVDLDPGLSHSVRDSLRAAIEVNRFPATLKRRDNRQLLFVGGFRHTPNLEALQWFFQQVVPHLKNENDRFTVVGAGVDPPPAYAFAGSEGILTLPGFVEDIQPLMSEASVFLCPILSGSGIRVKLLEAFAAGIPVVSTRIGAEGLADKDGLYCRLADRPEDFANAIRAIWSDPAEALAMAARARSYVERHWDASGAAARLATEYRRILKSKSTSSPISYPSGRG